MSNDSREPGEPSPESDAQKSRMTNFEQTIASYAQALEAGKTEEAQGAAMQALALAAEEAQCHPTPTMTLQAEAADCERKRDWAGAEAAYRKVVLLEEATGQHGLIAKAQVDLSRLLRLLGRLEEATQVAASATASARQAPIFPVQVMALENEVSCALATEEPQAALRAATEMVEVIEPDKLYDSMRARALVTQAKCLVATGDLAGAESRLAASWDLLQGPGVIQGLPGPTFVLANWWDIKSQLLEQQGELEAAREAMVESIDRRRRNEGPYAAFLLIGALERSALLLRQAGDLDQADRALAEANSLRGDLRLPVSG
jgi:tetratricopeptide (TPR) repeat protein